MASLVLKMSVSLDGYVAPPDGSSDWATAGRSEDGAAWTGAGDRLFDTPLTIEPISTTAFNRGAVAHVFAAHP